MFWPFDLLIQKQCVYFFLFLHFHMQTSLTITLQNMSVDPAGYKWKAFFPLLSHLNVLKKTVIAGRERWKKHTKIGWDRERELGARIYQQKTDKWLIINSCMSIRETKVLLCFEAFVLNYQDLLLMAVYHEVVPVNVEIKVPLYLLLTLLKWFT